VTLRRRFLRRGDVTADHCGHEAARVEFRTGVFTDELAIAQHCHAIADFVHLVEEVRDEQDGHALVAQAPDQREERFYFIRIQARGGFIENQHSRVGGDGTCNSRELLERGRQSSRELGHVEIDAETGEQIARAAPGLRPVDAAAASPAAARITPGADVFRDREIRQQVTLLVYGADAEFLRVDRGLGCNRAAE
jgi:hypothetical protein